MLTTADKEYLDITLNRAIDKSHKRFQKDTERYMGILTEKYLHEVGLTRELIETRPTRDEVRGMIREETQPIRQEIAIYKEELVEHRHRFEALEAV